MLERETVPHDSGDAGSAARWALIGGGSLLVLFGAGYAGAIVGFTLGLSLGLWVLLPALLGQVAFVVLAWRADDPAAALRRTVITLAVGWVVLIGLGLVSSRITDTTTDGRHYHGESIWALDQGWNPIRDPALTLPKGNPEIWSNSYPKASWVLEATVLKVTDDFEAGKLVGGALLIAAALVAFACMAEAGLPRVPAAAVAVVLALNPVSTFELGSHMVDGVVAALLLAVIVLSLLWLWKGNASAVMVPLVAALILLVNAKFTGLAFAVVLIGGIVVIGGIAGKLGARRVVTMVGMLAATVVVAMVAFGFNPYVTNTFRHDTPFYPVLGENSRPIDRSLSQGSFRNMTSVERLVRSVASASVGGRGEPKIKVPLTFSTSEWSAFRLTGLRVGGFGPLFSGALLIAGIGVVLLVVAVARRKVQLSGKAWAVFGAAGICLLTVVLMPDSFVARFAPQLWFVPAFVAAVLLLVDGAVVLKVLAWATLAILLFNAGGVGASSFVWDVRDTHQQEASIRRIKALPFALDAEFGVWPRAEKRRLRQNGIAFRAVDQVTCPLGYWLSVAGTLTRLNPGFAKRPVQGVVLCKRAAPD